MRKNIQGPRIIKKFQNVIKKYKIDKCNVLRLPTHNRQPLDLVSKLNESNGRSSSALHIHSTSLLTNRCISFLLPLPTSSRRMSRLSASMIMAED
jgi:hypothetical protein